MTLQVGLVGTDGIVLASDYLVGTSQEKHITSQHTKILLRDDRKIAACWSGDNDPSQLLAEQIVKNLSASDLQYPHPSVEKIAESALETRFAFNYRYDLAEAALVTVEGVPKLYQVAAQRNHGLSGDFIQCRCFQVMDKCVMGHRANAATFFSERFYEKLPVEKLVHLAAHIVLTGGRINPNGIQGLEIIVCTEKGFERLTEDRIAELTAWSSECDRQITRLLFPD